MMQHTQSIDTVKPRGSIRQGAGYATAPGFARCLSPEREHSDPKTANRVRQGAVCAAPHTLSTVSTRTQKTPRFASERLFSVVLHSESPERNTLSACIRNRRVRTPCRRAFACAGFERNASMHSESPERNTLSACIRNRRVRTPCRRAFACAGFERNASMHSESPERNAMSACIRICRSRTKRPQARQDRLRREATRWPAGWERRTRERHFHGQGRRAPWHRCRTASCATPASRRCPLPPAAPR